MIDLACSCGHRDVVAEAVPGDTTTVTVEEDSPQWSCREMGNRVCGPDNAEGVEPGFYGDPDEPIRSEWFGR